MFMLSERTGFMDCNLLIKAYQAMPLSCLVLTTDREFTIADASDAYLRDTKSARDQIIGRSLFSVFPNNPAAPESQGFAEVRASLQKVMATKTSDAMRIHRYDILLTDGSFEEKFWLTTNHPVFDEDENVIFIIHRVQDITQLSQVTDRKCPQRVSQAGGNRLEDRMSTYASDLIQVQALMLEEEQRWQAVQSQANEVGEKLERAIEAGQLGTFYCSLPARKMSWNETGRSHFFLTEKTEIDLSQFYQLIHADDRDMVNAAISKALTSGQAYDVQYRTTASGDRLRWLRARGRAYYNATGAPIRFDGITLDITHQKQQEEERRRIDRQKDEFLAMLAHELRNPLAPIRAAAQIMMLGPMDVARSKKTSEVINRQVIHMTALIDDLLDVSRVTRGLVTLDKKPVVMQEVLSDALEQTRPLILAKAQQLQLAICSDKLTVIGDRKRLIQIIANLLNNAAKYTQHGGILKVELLQENSVAILRVADNGAGISPALAPYVFDLFTQAQRTPDRRQGGLGIGLALVKNLVQLHDGQVTCESEGIDKGTTFTVKLQLQATLEKEYPPANKARSNDMHTSRLKVLVVDDNQDAAMMLAFAVETAGHSCSVEYDARCALLSMRNLAPSTIDVCLLDVGLPDIDGNELARRLRADPTTCEVALIAVTGYAQPRDLDAAIHAGFDRCLVKPIDLTELNALLEQISEQKAHGGPLRQVLCS
jgi:signal transduction histidine kinase/CheY-like chemotaxis protein